MGIKDKPTWTRHPLTVEGVPGSLRWVDNTFVFNRVTIEWHPDGVVHYVYSHDAVMSKEFGGPEVWALEWWRRTSIQDLVLVKPEELPPEFVGVASMVMSERLPWR